MKTFLKLFIALVFCMSSELSAQNMSKLGHINFQELISIMPETGNADSLLNEQRTRIFEQLKTMDEELKSLYNEYIVQKDTLIKIIRQSKETEIQSLDQNIKKFQQDADLALNERQAELINPIVKKAQNAVKEVAAENGYDYIYDTSAGFLIYYPEDRDNIINLVKVKLGIAE